MARVVRGRLGIGAGTVPVTLAAIATRAPDQDAGAQPLAGVARPIAELECEGQQLRRVRDRAELEPAAPEPEEDIGALDVGEELAVRDEARTLVLGNGGI